MNCQKDQKWVATLSAHLPLPLSGLPQPCWKIYLPEQRLHHKVCLFQGPIGDPPAATAAGSWPPALQVAPWKELEEKLDFAPLHKTRSHPRRWQAGHLSDISSVLETFRFPLLQEEATPRDLKVLGTSVISDSTPMLSFPCARAPDLLSKLKLPSSGYSLLFSLCVSSQHHFKSPSIGEHAQPTHPLALFYRWLQKPHLWVPSVTTCPWGQDSQHRAAKLFSPVDGYPGEVMARGGRLTFHGVALPWLYLCLQASYVSFFVVVLSRWPHPTFTDEITRYKFSLILSPPTTYKQNYPLSHPHASSLLPSREPHLPWVSPVNEPMCPILFSNSSVQSFS